MRSKLLLLLFAAFVDSNFAAAACAPTRPFCEALPDRSDPNAAIFLGLVKETVPAPPLVLPPTRPEVYPPVSLMPDAALATAQSNRPSVIQSFACKSWKRFPGQSWAISQCA